MIVVLSLSSRQILPKRPDLKVVITSATLETERFSRHFNNAPVLVVEGRTYPVELRYQFDEAAKEQDEVQAICDAVRELVREGPGDILVFLNGEREILGNAIPFHTCRVGR